METLTTRAVIFRIVIIITLAEFIIMLFLSNLPYELSIASEAVIDIVLLALMSIPLIYYWVIKPFVTARDDALAQISHLAHTDPLTNLPNRRMLARHFDKFMAGSVRRKVHGAVLLMDLDGFKLLNDNYGHDAGDEVLVEIADRIMSITRMEDVAARLGGDEFIILINQLDADEKIARAVVLRIADKLINLVNQPIMFEGKTLQVGASIGIRLLGMEELESETAIREADAAMYSAKQAGRGCAVFHE